MAARSRTAALLVLSLAAACNDSQPSVPPTFDRFYYPTGLAVRQQPSGCTAGSGGCTSQLFVASSNFDLRYDPLTGGTMLAVGVDQALGGESNASAGAFLSGAVLGSTRIGSFAGEVAVLDDASCPGWTNTGRNPQVLVASRAQNILYRLDVDPLTGALTCGEGCELPLPSGLADAYGVTVVCGNLAAAGGGSVAQRYLAFVTFLRAQSSEGYLTRVDLVGGTVEATYDVGAGPTQSTAFDKARGLLFASQRFSSVGVAPLRWIDLAFPQLGVRSVDYGGVVHGAELVSLALSSDTPPSRAYVAARLYDVDTATTTGARPTEDLGAVLLVLDLNRVLSGAAAAETVLNIVHLDRGPVALVTIPRKDASGSRIGDLVALTSTDDGTMTLYDDELGETAAVFGVCGSGSPVVASPPQPCPLGNPALGKQPYGIAWEPYQLGTQTVARLFVGSFDRSWVNAIVLDPAHPDVPISWARIGPERP